MRLMAKAWFGLTAHERQAIIVVLGLFLLGWGARVWHLSHDRDTAPHPAPISRSAEP